jgi:hypothetical protein
VAIQLYHGGESLGDSLITNSPIYTSGYIWYVSSAIGVDAASPRGRDRTRPLATLAQAHTSASDGDIIVLLDGHTETLTAAVTVSKRVKIVGAGRSGGKPTVKLTNNQASGSLLIFSGNHAQIRNVWIEEDAQSNDTTRISVTGDYFHMVDCYVESNSTSGGVAAVTISSSAQTPMVSGSTFISTATALTGQPYSGIEMAGAVDGLRLSGVIFDGGTKGYGGFHALIDNAGMTDFLFEDVSLLRGADMKIAAVATGIISGVSGDSSALIEFTGSGA